jgi:hypothetical protein
VSPIGLSSAAVKALTAQETGEVFLMLVTISQDDLADPLYFVNNTVDVTSRGNVYLGWPFQVALPDEREDALPTVQLQIDNVDRRIMEGVRLLSTPPSVVLEIVLADSPDTLERGPFTFRLVLVEYSALVITATLAPEDVLNEPAMQYSFTPANFPGLFP